MSLSISTSNVLEGQIPSIGDAGVGEVAANISDPNHSLNYTCGTGGVPFDIQYGSQFDISYVAISGHNAANPAPATIELYDDTLLIDSVTVKRNNNIMFTFPEQSFTNLKIRFVTSPATFQTTVSFIAAGQHLTLLTGEQSGYKRNWLNRHTTQRTTTNLQVGPVSSLTQSKALKGTLTLPNELAIFSTGEWQDFIDFAFDQPFFIKEVESKPESSYICFDPMPDTNSHSQTLKLDVLKLIFTVYNGL
jgi:hypothetical protein